MKIYADRLGAALAKELGRLHLLSADDPLLMQAARGPR